jgi:hypothetical protein
MKVDLFLSVAFFSYPSTIINMMDIQQLDDLDESTDN